MIKLLNCIESFEFPMGVSDIAFSPLTIFSAAAFNSVRSKIYTYNNNFLLGLQQDFNDYSSLSNIMHGAS